MLNNTNDTLRFAGAAEGFLRREPTGVGIREKYGELKDLGLKARRRINEEMSKLVRLKR